MRSFFLFFLFLSSFLDDFRFFLGDPWSLLFFFLLRDSLFLLLLFLTEHDDDLDRHTERDDSDDKLELDELEHRLLLLDVETVDLLRVELLLGLLDRRRLFLALAGCFKFGANESIKLIAGFSFL